MQSKGSKKDTKRYLYSKIKNVKSARWGVIAQNRASGQKSPRRIITAAWSCYSLFPAAKGMPRNVMSHSSDVLKNKVKVWGLESQKLHTF